MNEKKFNYYDIRNICKYEFDYTIIVGGRSNGKTTSYQKEIAVENYVNKSEQFIKIVRYVEDTYPNYNNDWFTPPVLNKLEEFGKTIMYKNKKYYIGDIEFKDDTKEFFKNADVFGYVIPLSQETRYKSGDKSRVSTIVFDEFCLENLTDYLFDEIKHFNSLISTINRMRDDVHVYLIGNALNMYNPYFDNFGIDGSKLKAGHIYTFKATEEFTEPATVGLEFVKMAYIKEDDVPRLLRVSNNAQSTNISQYELPKQLIKNDDWLVLALNNNVFEEYYKIKCILKCSIDFTSKFFDSKGNPYIIDTVDYCLIEEKNNKNNVYVIRSDGFCKEDYGLFLKLDKKYITYKFDNDIRNKLKLFDKNYFIGKNIIFGDLDIIRIFEEMEAIRL